MGRPPVRGGAYYPVGADCVLYHDYGDGLESAVDHSIYGNNGTVYGATFVENGLSFDGTDDYVNVAYTAEQNITGDLTIEGWVLFDGAMTYGVIIDRYYLTSWGIYGVAKNLSLYYSGTEFLTTGSPIVNYGAWYHIAVVVKKSTTEAWWYVNGVENRYINTFNPTVTGNTNDTKFGKMLGQEVLYFYSGDIGEKRVYNTPKTAVQIIDVCNFTKARYA